MQDLAALLSTSVGGESEPGQDGVATMIGALAFIVFAVASTAQLVVGAILDRFEPRGVLITVAAVQAVFFALMPGLTDAAALAVALGFMLGAFGEVPINDYLVARMASGPARARIYGIRYVVSFSALAASLPMIALIYDNWGFDPLFRLLSAGTFVILIAAALLPRRLPTPATTAE
jgi:MFS family permease